MWGTYIGYMGRWPLYATFIQYAPDKDHPCSGKTFMGNSSPNHWRINCKDPPQILTKLGVSRVPMVLITHANF